MPRPTISLKAQLATDHFIANAIIRPIVGYTWSQAMRAAGYAEKTIDRNSTEVLGRIGVQEQITKARDEIRASSIATRAERQQFWTTAYKGTLKDADGNQVCMTMNERLKASELLGRSEADFTDNLSTENKVLGITVNVKE